MTAAADSVYDTAFAAVEHGISVVPIRPDGSKAPVCTWTPFQKHLPTSDLLEEWFGGDDNAVGVAVICGAVSGNLECLEFETEEHYRALRERALETGCEVLLARLDTGYLERSPRGGYHWLYRAPLITGNTRLARRRKSEREVEMLIETRGEGGYVIIAPSAGAVHATKKPYLLLGGGFETIPNLCAEEHATLFSLARSFDEMPSGNGRRASGPAPSADRAGNRPGDEWAAVTDWDDILEAHGWTFIREARNGARHWRRPGKDQGISASTGFSDNDTLKVFSTSTDFDSDTTYTKFGAYALLNHGGDHKIATRALADLGFGQEERRRGDIPAPPAHSGTPANGRGPMEYPWTDTGNAELLVDAFGSEWCYDYKRGQWMRWAGHWWAPDAINVITERAIDTARLRYGAALACEGDGQRTAGKKFARQSESSRGLDAMLKIARALPAVKIDGTTWNQDPWLLGVENGVVDLRTGVLRDGQRNDHITQHVPWEYDERAKCPRFERFLDEIMGGNIGLRQFLTRAIAYSITGSVREQCLFLCYGRGKNGKSTLLNLLQWLLGDDPASGYARTIGARALQYSHGTPTQSESLSVIVGKRIVSASELSIRAFDEERLKSLAGGDIINTRFLYRETFDFRPVAKLWLSFNSRPSVRDDSTGFWRKVRMLPFRQEFDPAQEPDLEAVLKAELPGILAYAVRNVEDWLERGLAPPPEVLTETERYREESDPLTQFITDVVVRVDGSQVATKRLYHAYCAWASDQGIVGKDVLTSTAFGRRVGELFERNRSSVTRYYVGMEIRSLETPSDDAMTPDWYSLS